MEDNQTTFFLPNSVDVIAKIEIDHKHTKYEAGWGRGMLLTSQIMVKILVTSGG